MGYCKPLLHTGELSGRRTLCKDGQELSRLVAIPGALRAELLFSTSHPLSEVSFRSVLCYCNTYFGQLPVQLLPERDMQLQKKMLCRVSYLH